MAETKRIVIVGATSGIAVASARLWAARGARHIVLVGRHVDALEAIASDLRVRGDALEVSVLVDVLTDPATIEAAVDEAFAVAGEVDTVVVAHGWMGSQETAQSDVLHAAEVLKVTAVSPVLWAEAFAHRFEQIGRGRIGIISSVAGDRGRKTNYVYGSAKALLNAYAAGMVHRFAGSPITVTAIKPGPTDTVMNSELKAKGARLAPVRGVAKQLVDGVEAGRPVVYAPGIWRLIMLVIRNLPGPVFNRLSI